jgi:hypothetical protein
MNLAPLYLIITTPLILNILAVFLYRGLFRVLAAGLLIPIGFAAACDIYSASKQGNLTGIITICVSGPSLVALFILGIVNVFVRVPLSRGERSSQPKESDNREW